MCKIKERKYLLYSCEERKENALWLRLLCQSRLHLYAGGKVDCVYVRTVRWIAFMYGREADCVYVWATRWIVFIYEL